jgi:phage terminase large subunit
MSAPIQVYERFCGRYQNDTELFSKEVAGMLPTGQQLEMLKAYDKPAARVSCRSGHGTGKTADLSIISLQSLLTKPFSRVIITSGSLGTITGSLWPEISTWFHRIVKQPEYKMFANWFFVGRTMLYHKQYPDTWNIKIRVVRKENPQTIAGAHCENLLYLVEEASSLAENPELFDVLDGALTSGPGNKMILVGNPTLNYGRFYESHHTRQSEYECLHWNAEDSPLVSQESIDKFKNEYGELSREYAIRIKGDFPDVSEGMLIGRDSITRNYKKIEVTEPTRVIFSDVAGEGRDSSTIGVADIERDEKNDPKSFDVRSLEEYQSLSDTMKLSTMLFNESLDNDCAPVIVDAIGIGKGVVDKLNELETARQAEISKSIESIGIDETEKIHNLKEIEIIGFIAGSRPTKPKFYNARAQQYHQLKKLLEAENAHLPRNKKLVEQLGNIPYKYSEKGVLQIISKEDFVKLGLKSPDLADSLMIGLTPVTGTVFSERNRKLWEKLNKEKQKGDSEK